MIDTNGSLSASAQENVGACTLEETCYFARAVTRNPVLKVKYANMRRYCRGGDSAQCARLRAHSAAGNPADNLLPDGTLDALLSGRAQRVLVVDDVPVFRKLMEGIVARAVSCVEIVSAENGRQALEVLRRNQIDLVVTDFNMPELDGGELVQEMRRPSAQNHVPVLVFTTENDSGKRAEVLTHERVRWVQKSSEREAFVQAIDELMIQGLA